MKTEREGKRGAVDGYRERQREGARGKGGRQDGRGGGLIAVECGRDGWWLWSQRTVYKEQMARPDGG